MLDRLDRGATIRRTLLLAGGALALGACADGATTAPQADVDALARSARGEQMALKEGALYVAELHPLNAWVQQSLDPDPRSGTVVSGKAYFRVHDGMLHAVVDVRGAEPAEGAGPLDGLHPQHIHAADQCPTASADTNGDRIVDVIEGVPFYGPILVSLDQDLANLAFETSFPVATGRQGTYLYETSTAVATLEEAIAEMLDLPRRHVVVHGVDAATPLPPTVQSLGGLPATLTLPVACGEIREVR